MPWINRETQLGGAEYPFLKRLGQAWALETLALDNEEAFSKKPTLRWVNDDGIKDLYIKDMETTDFLKAIGLELDMHKGGFVLSKRLNRLFRPYWSYGFFPRERIQVRYLDLDEGGMKLWDGAGRIARSLLLRLLEQLPPQLADHKRRQLEAELRHCKRIEFTVMGLGDWSKASLGGQDKGHAYVVEDLDVDLELPKDTKSQVRLVDGQVFIGLYPVHAADEMRLDVQSLINLHPFFRYEDLMTWLHAEGELFLKAVRSGDVATAMSRLRAYESLEEVNRWHLREYFASAGHPMWFGAIIKALLNQHLKRINHQVLEDLRLPIPGYRYYVMVDELAKKSIARGFVQLEASSATAWVNRQDWLEFAASVWGGADQDDALWCFLFQDAVDDKQKVLLWRSPNQLGEYILLEPTGDSDLPAWATAEGAIHCPPADSRQLPERIDQITVDYLHLVDATTGADLGEDLPYYSVPAMQPSIQRAFANKGALGSYCNLLMLSKALYGTLPQHPPAALETVIDGAVKTGWNLAPVQNWVYQACRRLLETGIAIPEVLLKRLSIDYEAGIQLPRPKQSKRHWLDQLMTGIQDHILAIELARDLLMSQAQAPRILFESALIDSQYFDLGARFTQGYTAKLSWTKGKRKRPSRLGLEAAREWSEAFLEHFKPAEQRAILRGSLAHYYLKPQHSGADEMAWQLGAKSENGNRESGIAQITLEALREIGILDELLLEDGYLLSYPAARILELSQSPIVLHNVWFNLLRAHKEAQGQSIPQRMQEVSENEETWAKAEVARLAQSGFKGLELALVAQEERLLAYSARGKLFAYLPKAEDRFKAGIRLVLDTGFAREGHLNSLYHEI